MSHKLLLLERVDFISDKVVPKKFCSICVKRDRIKLSPKTQSFSSVLRRRLNMNRNGSDHGPDNGSIHRPNNRSVHGLDQRLDHRSDHRSDHGSNRGLEILRDKPK